MKKIYTITLTGDAPSGDIVSDTKLVGYFLCSTLDTFETSDGKPVMYEDGIMRNELLETEYNGRLYYHFTSDNPKIINKLAYEPFIIEANSFGFTVFDDSIVNYAMIIEELSHILETLEKTYGLKHYNFYVEEVDYDDTFDTREETIKHMVLGVEVDSTKQLPKKKVLTKLPILGILGR